MADDSLDTQLRRLAAIVAPLADTVNQHDARLARQDAINERLVLAMAHVEIIQVRVEPRLARMIWQGGMARPPEQTAADARNVLGRSDPHTITGCTRGYVPRNHLNCLNVRHMNMEHNKELTTTGKKHYRYCNELNEHSRQREPCRETLWRLCETGRRVRAPRFLSIPER